MTTVDASFKAFPNELLLEIFGSLHRGDLIHVVQASHKFYDLALRLLYRHVVWTDPLLYMHSLPLWNTRPAFEDVPRSLVIGLCQERRDHVVAADVVELDGSLRRHVQMPSYAQMMASIAAMVAPHEAHRLVRHKIQRAASSYLYRVMTQQVAAFTSLSSLAFKHAILPGNFYAILEALPTLRTLSLETCSITSESKLPQYDLSLMPITELTLLDIDVHRTAPHPLLIATALKLRTLHCDMSACAFRMFAKKAPGGGDHIVPPELSSIHFHMPEKRFWPANMLDFSENTYYFIEFLKMCPEIRHVTIGGFMPTISLPDHIVPALQSYKGPLLAASSFARGRSVSKIDLVDLETGPDLWDWIKSLQTLAECQSSIRELSITIPSWDDEIIHAVVNLFPELRKFHVMYYKRCISEDTVLAIGPHFAALLPHLNTLHLYSPVMKSAATLLNPKHAENSVERSRPFTEEEAERELKGSVGSWDRYCPNLREVQLLPGFVWRRADSRKGEATAAWDKRGYLMEDGERSYL